MKTVEDISDQCIRILDKISDKYKSFFTPEIMVSETYYMTEKEKTIYFNIKNKLISLEPQKREEAKQRILKKRLTIKRLCD